MGWQREVNILASLGHVDTFKVMNYVAEVAACILSHCRKRDLLGPDVYAAIAEWEKEGVPRELVRASIAEAFLDADGHHDGNPPVALIKGAVVRNFKNWLAQSGQKCVRPCDAALRT